MVDDPSVNVLVVDDDPTIAQSVVHMLLVLGIASQQSNSYADARAYLDKVPLDVLVTDVDLNGEGTGIDLAERARLANPSIRVVVMSGHGISALSEHDPRIENYAFLPKPFVIDDLVAALAL